MKWLNHIFSFFIYLRSPVIPQQVKPSRSIPFFICFFLFSLLMDRWLDYIATSKYLLDIFDITDAGAFNEDIYKQGLLVGLLVVGLIIPIFEELTHRYYLISFKWNNAILPFSLAYILIQLFNIVTFIDRLIILGLAAIIAITVYREIARSDRFKIRCLKFYMKHYWIYFYASAISFGLAHIGNYHIQHFVPVIPMVLVVPQIFAGLLLGYIRIIMGLRWSIGFHSLHNLIVILILFISHDS